MHKEEEFTKGTRVRVTEKPTDYTNEVEEGDVGTVVGTTRLATIGGDGFDVNVHIEKDDVISQFLSPRHLEIISDFSVGEKVKVVHDGEQINFLSIIAAHEEGKLGEVVEVDDSDGTVKVLLEGEYEAWLNTYDLEKVEEEESKESMLAEGTLVAVDFDPLAQPGYWLGSAQKNKGRTGVVTSVNSYDYTYRIDFIVKTDEQPDRLWVKAEHVRRISASQSNNGKGLESVTVEKTVTVGDKVKIIDRVPYASYEQGDIGTVILVSEDTFEEPHAKIEVDSKLAPNQNIYIDDLKVAESFK